MMKRFIILIFSSFLGIAANPEILMASDSVALTGVSNAGIVETVVLEEPVATSTVESVAVTNPVAPASPATTSATPATPTAPATPAVAPAPVYVAPANSIQVAGRTLRIVDVDSTAVNSGDHVNKYGDKFLYGHNSAAVFGGLYNMGVGSVFTVTYGGATKNYQVQQVVVFEKNNGLLQLNGAGSYMLSVSKARYSGVNYDLSLMTCYGTSYGNGDASHRLVLFANAI